MNAKIHNATVVCFLYEKQQKGYVKEGRAIKGLGF